MCGTELRQTGKEATRLSQSVREAVFDPAPLFLPVDQPGFAQYLEVMRQEIARHIECRLKFTDTGCAPCQQTEDLQPCRIAEGFEASGQSLTRFR